MQTLTDDFIRDVVIPEIERSGGATVEVPTSGNMSPALLVAAADQPRTWIVDTGPVAEGVIDWQTPRHLRIAAALVMRYAGDSVYTGVGFWLDPNGVVEVDLVECYTLRTTAVIAAKEHGQDTIYELHTGRCEFVADLVSA